MSDIRVWGTIHGLLHSSSITGTAIICTFIPAAGFYCLKGMNWIPSLLRRRPFFDHETVEEQLEHKIAEHNLSVRQKLSPQNVVCKPDVAELMRRRSLRSSDRPAFDASYEPETPPSSDLDSSPEPQVITPLTRKKSAPCIRVADATPVTSSKANHAAVHKLETLHLLLKSLSTNKERLALRSFLQTVELMAPHLISFLMEQEIPISESLRPPNGKSGSNPTLESKLRSFLTEFSSMIKVEDKWMILLITDAQVKVALATVDEVMDKELTDYIKGLISRQISRSVYLKDLHRELRRFYPYASANKFMTATVLCQYLGRNGFEANVNGVVRVYEKPLRRPNLAKVTKDTKARKKSSGSESGDADTPDSTTEQLTPDNSPTSDSTPKSRLKKSVSFSEKKFTNHVLDSDTKSGQTATSLSEQFRHGPKCLCGTVDFVAVARRLPAARLKVIWAERYDCLLYQFCVLVNKDKDRMTAGDN